MNDVKKARKQIDIFIRRLILLCNKCNALKEHLSTSNASGEFNMDILTDITKYLPKVKRVVVKYLDLDKSIEELYKYLRYLEDRLRDTPTFLYTEKDKVGYNASEDTIDSINSVMYLARDIIYGVCHLVPIVGHKYLVENEGIASFTAPVDKKRVLGREE